MKSNTRFSANKKGIECLNCKQPISSNDNFCSNCGQVNDTKPLSIKQYLTEFLAGFFSFDTRTINTIVPLLFKPGRVTNEYIHGERMKYVNPFQLYLHTSIIFFLITGIFSSVDSYNEVANNYKLDNQSKIKKDSLLNIVKSDVDKDLQKNDIDVGFLKVNFSEKDTIKKFKFNSIIDNLVTKKSDSLFFSTTFDNTVKDTLLSVNEKDKIIDHLILKSVSNLYTKLSDDKRFKTNSEDDFQDLKTIYINNLEEKIKINNINYIISSKVKMQIEDQYLSNFLGQSFFNKISKFKICKTKNVGKALDSLGYKRTSTNIFWFKKVGEYKVLQKNKDAQKAYIDKLISKIAIVLFFMLPVFALFMKLFYIRRKINYTEHLIFIFHTQTVFFLMLLLTIIINRIFKIDIAIPIATLLFLVYLFIAMRKFYKQGKWKTFFKFMLLNLTYLFLSIIGLIIVAFLAFLM